MHVLRLHSSYKKSESLLFGPGNLLCRCDACDFGAHKGGRTTDLGELMNAKSNVKSKQWPVWTDVFSLGSLSPFFFFSYRFSDGKTWFLEISSYPLNHLGCCDVRNYPCQSSWLSLSQTRHAKIVRFPLVIQCMLPALSNVIMSKKLCSRSQNRLSSKLIMLKHHSPLLAQGRPWEGSSYYVFINILLCIICKLNSFTFFFLKGSPPTWISFSHHPKPVPILAKSL